MYRLRAEIIHVGLMENYMWNYLKNYMVGEGVKSKRLKSVVWYYFYCDCWPEFIMTSR